MFPKSLIFSLFLSCVSATSLPIYVSKEVCPSSYNSIGSHCFLKGSDVQLTTKDSLTTTYAKDFTAVTGHYVVITASSTSSESDDIVPVADLPIELIATENSQPILLIDESGQMVSKTLKPYHPYTFKTSIAGTLAFTIPISTEEDVNVQEFWIRSPDMPHNKYVSFEPHTSIVKALAKLSPETLQTFKKDMSMQEASAVTEKISNLLSIASGPSSKKAVALVSGTSLMSASKKSKDLFLEDWKNIKKGTIQSIEVVKDVAKKVWKAMVKTVKGIVEFVITTVDAAVKILTKVLELAGLAVLTVIDGIKTIVRWDQVLNTQDQINAYIYNVRDTMPTFLKNNREKAVAFFESMDQSVHAQVKALISKVKGEHKEVKELAAGPFDGSYTFVTDAMNANSDKISYKDNNSSENTLIDALDEIIESGSSHNEVVEAAKDAKRLNLKNLGREVIAALLTVIDFAFKAVNIIVKTVVDLAIKLFTATSELFWIIMSFEVEIPFISAFYRRAVSNGRHNFSLLHLSTFPSSIVYTYAYMITHLGKAPFPAKVDGPTSASLPEPTRISDDEGLDEDDLISDAVGGDSEGSLSIMEKGLSRFEGESLYKRSLGLFIGAAVAMVIFVLTLELLFSLLIGLSALFWSAPMGFTFLILFLYIALRY